METPFKMTLPAINAQSANDQQQPIIDNVIKTNGFVPNMYANMINSPGLLETYLFGYNKFRNEGGFTPAEQEVVFLTISYENNCEYCMAAHSVLAEKMSKVPAQAIEAIRSGNSIEDEKLHALTTFTRVMFITRGRPEAASVHAFLQAGYSERQILEIILALAVKTLSNYSNHLFNTAVDSAFSVGTWKK